MVLNACLAAKISFQELQVPEDRLNGSSKEDESLVEEDRVREYLSKLDVCKSMGHGDMHSQVLKEQQL